MRHGHRLVIAVFVTACTAALPAFDATVRATPAPSAITYSILNLGDLGGADSSASELISINDQGQVAGSLAYEVNAQLVQHSFLWTQATGMVDLGVPAGWESVPLAVIATGLNNSGEVTGTISNPYLSTPPAFTWTAAGGMRWLSGLALGDLAKPVAINDSGEIVGNDTKPDGTPHAVVWSPGHVITDLGAIDGIGSSVAIGVNNTGQVVGQGAGVFSWTPSGGVVDVGSLPGGTSDAIAVGDNGEVIGWDNLSGLPPAYHAFVWTAADGMKDLGTLGGYESQPFAVNANGQVVGWSTTASGDGHAFSWTPDGGMVDLGTLGGTTSSAKAVNDSGQVVGYSTTATGAQHAFVWSAATGMVDLGNFPGYDSEAVGINAAGQIVGLSHPSSSQFGPYVPTLWAPSTSNGGGGGGGGAPTGGTQAKVDRLSGADRVGTAVAISRGSFADHGASAVVLATATDYPDALVGAPLAAAKNAPLLLTEGATTPAATQQELARVLAQGGTVYLLGGTQAIPASVSTQLEGAGYNVVRLAGADRFATSVAVADALGDPATVLLASGANFPDALAAGPAAAHVDGAVLLTNGRAMPAATATYLQDHAATVYAVGGPAASADPSAVAIAGVDRYATAAAIATTFFDGPQTVGVATGSTFPDALAGAAQLGRADGPLLLAGAVGLYPATRTYLASNSSTVTAVHVYGGTTALSDDVITQIRTALAAS